MKCVHGIDLEIPCVYCGSLGRFTENRPDDHLANEIASLAQAIQGLLGNVAKLVEERTPVPVPSEDSRWSDEEISSTSRNPIPPYEFNRIPEIPKEWFKTVKRGPVTDEERWTIESSFMGDSALDYEDAMKLKAALEAFAKSRGLID